MANIGIHTISILVFHAASEQMDGADKQHNRMGPTNRAAALVSELCEFIIHTHDFAHKRLTAEQHTQTR